MSKNIKNINEQYEKVERLQAFVTHLGLTFDDRPAKFKKRKSRFYVTEDIDVVFHAFISIMNAKETEHSKDFQEDSSGASPHRVRELVMPNDGFVRLQRCTLNEAGDSITRVTLKDASKRAKRYVSISEILHVKGYELKPEVIAHYFEETLGDGPFSEADGPFSDFEVDSLDLENFLQVCDKVLGKATRKHYASIGVLQHALEYKLGLGREKVRLQQIVDVSKKFS